MRKLLSGWLFFAVLFSVACGKYGGFGNDPIATMQLGLDGVKLIERGETRGDLPSHFEQESYRLDDGRRLLLRFEAFSEEVSRVNVEGTNKVWIEITVLTEDQVEPALAALKLCPLTRAWMMLATWELGHPFGAAGRWNEPGGDFDRAGCVSAQLKEAGTRGLRFDVTKWFNDYPRGRGENFGLILVSESSINMHGDRSGTYAPRFSFDSYTPSFVR